MTDRLAPAEPGATTHSQPFAPDTVVTATPVDEVRSLLRAADQSELDELRERVRQLEELVATRDDRADAVSEVLADAIHLRPEDAQLRSAMQPYVSDAIHQTSRDDPELIAEALSPVIGRAVRMMIANMVPGGGPQDDQGKVPYSVDHLYLIERDSGLPIASASAADSADSTGASDADVISGMLEAIRSFVQDSFGADEVDGMRELSVGGVTVWVEWGPKALLAAVMSGVPPTELRFSLQELLEQLHRDFAIELSDFDGNDEHTTAIQAALTEGQSRQAAIASEGGPSAGQSARNWVPIAGFLLVVLVVVVAIVLAVS